ncbi:hypothetical protein [Streptomyces sp. TRM68416]|uniref:hypothetical protein n=1 Tax=Streptomyces sp. TRM68416 TaxID=2758412 RepID=UPI001661FA8C|nr:hypothetical protein [Streptomyces sp. TRM68416]MBD0838819.1 hypothetical protein [Streptomyces sp. TRM68416]
MTTTAAKRLMVEQAELSPGIPMVFREFDDKIRMAYDPEQMPPVAFDSEQARAMAARQFLGIYATYTEGPELDRLRETYNGEPVGSPLRDAIGIMFDDIDRTQDPAGVARQYVELLEQVRGEKSGACA